MPVWLTAVLTFSSLLLGGGGGAAILQAVTGRRSRKAEVADRLSDSTLKWVEEFQEEARNARAEAAEARREAQEARRELADVRREAEALIRDLRELRAAVLSPGATVERLRAMVGGEGMNGRF